MTTIRERVRRGMTVLDAHEPGWDARLDLDELCMRYCDTCVLGQIFGDYIVGTLILLDRSEHLEPMPGDWLSDEEEDWAIDHGFHAGFECWSTLREAWLAELHARRTQLVPAIPELLSV